MKYVFIRAEDPDALFGKLDLDLRGSWLDRVRIGSGSVNVYYFSHTAYGGSRKKSHFF